MNLKTDGLGFRRYKEVVGQGVTYFVYDLAASDVPGLAPLVAEYDANGNLVAKYHHDGGLIAMTRGNQSYWHVFEAIGTVRQLVNVQSQITDAYAYDAWGKELAVQGSTVNPHRYVGKYGYYFDTQSALMLLGVRYYGAEVGRFVSLDPITDGINWYVYVHDNPITNTDPSGEQPRRCRFDRDCPPDMVARVGMWCRRIREPWPFDRRNKINRCIQNTAAKFGIWCNLLTVERIQCLRNFCRGEGVVKCNRAADDPDCRGACGYVAQRPRDPHFDPGNRPTPINPIVTLCLDNVFQPGCRNSLDRNISGLDHTFLHELAHACGIAHVHPDPDRQCNDIWACCLYDVIMRGGNGTMCWQAAAVMGP